jgi:MFS superfamily sulfate permease-like transporter
VDARLIAPWLRGYQPAWLGRDGLAGVVAACVGGAPGDRLRRARGLPVQTGLDAALVPMVVYALFGSSSVLSVSVRSP